MNRMTPPLANAAKNDIGGAICRRMIQRGQEVWKRPGDLITAEEVATIPASNLTALRDSGYLQVFPKDPGTQPTVIASNLSPIVTTRFAIHRGCGKYDVIEGVQLNAEQLTKEEAEALCAIGANPSN